MINLGYANGWITVPEIREKCKCLEHKLVVKNIGRCLNQYTCEICKYTYKVDSSD
jgi:hypothetical protein